MSTLILGGARSGKSRLAQKIAEQSHANRIYIATAEALDAEMTDRIRRHRQDRGSGWSTIEEPLDLLSALQNATQEPGAVLVDCLTLWLSNLMHHNRQIDAETQRLVTLAQTLPDSVIFVSNEVGLGIVPDNAMGRNFQDVHGRLNQEMAAVCGRVELTIAGLPMTLKG